ncbi:Glioma tumor suppressor-like protein [Daphnia magna]|uniref:Glioma tumor suppressor-like protein n=1 Tax=Daphnia magna TaxID=35525 RepID=A0A164NGV5_9CRUS|nr:Glioma tumor suppressor-like protein [Daphnia magna]
MGYIIIGVAFDNYDRFVETLTGKDTLHDTVGIVYQDVSECIQENPDEDEVNPEDNEDNQATSFDGRRPSYDRTILIELSLAAPPAVQWASISSNDKLGSQSLTPGSLTESIDGGLTLEDNWWSENTQGLGDEEEPAKEEEEVPCVRPTKPKTRKQKIRTKALKWQDCGERN